MGKFSKDQIYKYWGLQREIERLRIYVQRNYCVLKTREPEELAM